LNVGKPCHIVNASGAVYTTLDYAGLEQFTIRVRIIVRVVRLLDCVIFKKEKLGNNRGGGKPNSSDI